MRLGRRVDTPGEAVLATTDELPGQVVEDVLGLVIGGAPDAQRAFAQLQEVADELGATAVIGVRLAVTATGGVVFSSQEAIAYGTAVVTYRGHLLTDPSRLRDNPSTAARSRRVPGSDPRTWPEWPCRR